MLIDIDIEGSFSPAFHLVDEQERKSGNPVMWEFFLNALPHGAFAMTIIKSGLFLVFERFPDRKATVKALYQESENFQSLCDDYRQCAAALRYWEQSSEDYAPARRHEYTALLQELEEEIAKFLKVSEQA
jgi:hypothetical protein